MILANISPEVYDVFDLTNLKALFKCRPGETVDEALALHAKAPTANRDQSAQPIKYQNVDASTSEYQQYAEAGGKPIEPKGPTDRVSAPNATHAEDAKDRKTGSDLPDH